MRKSRKLIAILATLAMLATLLVPMVTPAAADTGYTAYSTPTVGDDEYFDLGTVIIETPADAITGAAGKESTLILSLPGGFKFIDDKTNAATVTASTYTFAGDAKGQLIISAPQSVGGTPNSLYSAAGTTFTAALLDDNQVKIQMKGNYNPASGDKAFFKIQMNAYVDSGYSGEISLAGDAPSSSGFPTGSVVVGNVPGGQSTISVVDKDTSNDNFTVKLRVKENKAGALKDATDTNESIKLTLPDGFKWTTASGAIAESTIWGNDLNLTLAVDKEEAAIKVDTKSSVATCFEITLGFTVSDETEAQLGDVKADVAGDSSLAPDSLVVGTYADYVATIKVDGDVKEAFAGETEQDINDIVIKEGMKGSLINDRTVLLTLPANARWIKIDNKYVIDRDLNADGDKTDLGEPAQLTAGGQVDSDHSVDLVFSGLTGTDDRTAKFTIKNGPSDGAATLKIEKCEIALEAGKTGDVTVAVSGSEGLTGDLVVAKAVAPVTASAESKPEVQIGKSGQVAADFTITETKKGAIKKDKALVLDLPEGIAFAAVPKVEVTEGDLKIDSASVRRGDSNWTKDNQVIIPIDNDSNKPSTIKVTGIKYVLDRTVPEGAVNVAVAGSAVVETVPTWPNSKAAAVAANAVCVTPAPGEQHAKVVFTINGTKYTVNGVEKEMDAAPYIKNSRTFIPVRYAAEACGVTHDNIMFADGKVTLIKGDKVVQLAIGSNVMLINGIAVSMDAAAEIAPPGRTMLPFRWVAQALGASVTWDEATQTVTMEL